jgi:predicted flap endonuclease-1-like 5' DNA nuclease
MSGWPTLAALVAAVGLVVAILQSPQEQAGAYLGTLLFLVCGYVVGSLLGAWVRNARSRAELAMLKAVESAREVAAARVAEDARRAAAAQAAEDTRRAAETRAAEEARQAAAAQAAEDARRAAEARAAEEARQAAAAQAAEDARRAAEAKAAEEAREAAALAATGAGASASHPGSKPPGIMAPEGGKADNLKLIKGIGSQNERRLHGLGIWHFAQVAAWSAGNVKWVSSYLAFSGRIDREQWVSQARELAAGRDTEFSRRVASGKVPGSSDGGSQGKTKVRMVEPRI